MKANAASPEDCRPPQAIGTAFGILTGIGTLLSWFTPEWFGQLTWPQAILVGIAFALAILLSLSLAVAISGWGRRQWKPSTAEPVADEVEVIDWPSREAVQLEAKIDALTAELRKLRRETEAHRSLDSDRWRQQVSSLYDALAAVYHRERLQRLAATIEAGAVELSAPTDNALISYDQEQWEEWEAKERAWRSELERWCELASCYVQGIGAKVLSADADHYKRTGQAKIEQFPTPEAYIGYKEFCALWKNWRNWQDEAMKAVHQVAFNGGTADERPVMLGEKWLGNLDV